MIAGEYRRLVLECHPDRHPGDEAAASRFQSLQQAWATLGDPGERKFYDQWANAGLTVPYPAWRATIKGSAPVRAAAGGRLMRLGHALEQRTGTPPNRAGRRSRQQEGRHEGAV